MRAKARVFFCALLVILLLYWPKSQPPPPDSPCIYRECESTAQLEAKARDISKWLKKYQASKASALQSPFDHLHYEDPYFDLMLQNVVDKQSNVVHFTSYHFARGDAVANWAAHLGDPTKLLVMTPFARVCQQLRAQGFTAVVDASRLLAPWTLCHRDPGSGVKVRSMMEIVKRRYNVIYSDADVVWLQPPSFASLHADTDIAFQIYDVDQRGVNFGLCMIRASPRVSRFLRRLFVLMQQSITVHENLEMDTCNDQNNLNDLLFKFQPQLVCGSRFKGAFSANENADADHCLNVERLDPVEYPLVRNYQSDSKAVKAMHMSSYWGGHTFAKIFWLQQARLWKPSSARRHSAVRRKVLRCSFTGHSFQKQQLFIGISHAIKHNRTLVLPVGVDRHVQVEPLLLLNRALFQQQGYGDDVDQLCGNCGALVSLPHPMFAPVIAADDDVTDCGGGVAVLNEEEKLKYDLVLDHYVRFCPSLDCVR